MVSDYDQAMFLIGACTEGSGIKAGETLDNPNFRPHHALGELLEWFGTHGWDVPTRGAARTAATILAASAAKRREVPAAAAQISLFGDETAP